MSEQSHPLAGRHVLLTRPAERARGLAARLEWLGASVDSRPAIAFESPPDAAAARRAASGIADYDWIAFTSATGVRFFLEQLDAVGLGVGDVGAAIAVVGPATAREAVAAGLSPRLVAREPRAEGLADELCRHVQPCSRVLLVRPEVTRPVLARALEEAGAAVDAVAFYRTVPAPGIEFVARDLERGRYHAAVFASPSAVHAVCRAGAGASAVLGAVRVVAIGEVTGQALRAAGRAPDAAASDPSEAGIARVVLDVLVRPTRRIS